MVRRIQLGPEAAREPFANPVPLGLIGLAIGCAALVPSTLGHGLTPAGLKTAAVFALLFGAGCQLLAGLMLFANRNPLSGTVFTAFSFLWLVNSWSLDSLARGVLPDHSVVLATEVVLLVIFLALTYAFGFFSKLLFLFLLDIDLLFAVRLIRSILGSSVAPGSGAAQAFNLTIGGLTVVLAALALWLAFGALINPVAGRQIFRIGGPLLAASNPGGRGFDWTLRRKIFDTLYEHWRTAAYRELPLQALREATEGVSQAERLVPDLRYLEEFGYLKLTLAEGDDDVASARLSAQGIDLYEQLVLEKYA